jgi:hypothetical protein
MYRPKSLFVLPFFVAAVGICMASTASAALLIYEPFDYTAGQPIEGQVNPSTGNTWNAAGPATAPVHSVVSPGLTSPPGFLPAVGNAADTVNTDTSQFDRLDIPNAFNPDLSPKYGANSTLYYSLLLNVPDIAGLNTPNSNANANNDMMIAFNNIQGAQAARPSNWGGELVIRLGSTSDTYNLGIRASSTPGGTTYWTGDLTPGDTHLVVVRYVQGSNGGGNSSDDSNDLWINPSALSYGAPEGSEPSPDGSSTGSINQANPALNYAASLIIGAGISNVATVQNPDHTYLDEIRVGTTWADVTSIVPEPASLWLLLIGCMLPVTGRQRR